MPIFVEHWGDNLQFYPNFALFSTLRGMNLDHDFFQLSKLGEDQTKRSSPKMEHFFPEFRWRPKQKSSPKLEHFFPRILVETCAQMNTQARSQKFAMGGCLGGLGAPPPAAAGQRGSGDEAPSCRRLGVWGWSPQPPEARGSGGGAPSARKGCIFLQK